MWVLSLSQYKCLQMSMSHFEAEHSIQQVVCISDVRLYETVALQQLLVFCGTPLFPRAHAEGLKQPATGAPSVFIQEDLT